MIEKLQKFPDQEEIEKELSDYLSKKYGRPIKVVSPMMMPEAKKKDEGGAGAPPSVEKIRFDMKPEELEAYLDQYVVKQEDAKAVLATKICTHYNRIRWQQQRGRAATDQTIGRIKNNIVLIGPTGVGKTYLVKLIAQKLGVPFVKGDATKFSETGYVGGDVEDLIRDLVKEADDDIQLAQYGIVFIDEIDKIASSRNLVGPDVSRTGVQRALLKPLEETEVDLRVPHDPISQIQAIEHYRKTGKREKQTINTRNILFIVSGAFGDLASIVKRRVESQGVGFGANVQSRENDYRYLKSVKAEDLIAYGFESEFVGRLPVVAVLEPLTEDDLYDILRNPNNPVILGKKEDFRSYGIDLKFDDTALRLIAEMAYREKTGARGLVSVIERVLLPFEKRLPSSSVRYLTVTEEVVQRSREELEFILLNPEDPDRLHRYERLVGEEKESARDQVMRRKKAYIQKYPFVFSPDRLELLLDEHLCTGITIEALFDEFILLYNQVKVFEDDFHEQHGFRIHFDDQAINAIMHKAIEQGLSASEICRRISRDYDYGFNLVADRSGQTQFILPEAAVEDPGVYLDELIRETYRRHPLKTPDMHKEL